MGSLNCGTLCREIQIAALEEDYAMAARLRDESGVVMQQLPPLRQYMWGRLQVLQSGNRAEQLAAITNLGVPCPCIHD